TVVVDPAELDLVSRQTAIGALRTFDADGIASGDLVWSRRTRYDAGRNADLVGIDGVNTESTGDVRAIVWRLGVIAADDVASGGRHATCARTGVGQDQVHE